MFDLSFFKLLTLAVIALVIFGPNELPKMVAQAGRVLRDLRRIADSARDDLRAGLGPEFQDFDFNDLNPKQFVRKHLLDDLEAGFNAPSASQHGASQHGASQHGASQHGASQHGGTAQQGLMTQQTTTLLAPGETPPYDVEAT